MNIKRLYQRNQLGLLLLATAIFLTGCEFFKEEPGIERDRRERQEILDGLFVTYWKGAKISIRSMPIDANTKTIDFSTIKEQQAKDLNLGKHLSRIYDWEALLSDVDQESSPLSAGEFIELAREIHEMADTVENMDEDVYPTFAEIIQHSNRILKGETIELPPDWNNAMDHWLFALVMESRFGLGSWKTYELAKTNPREMATSDYRVASGLHKGIDALRNQWYYLADVNFSQAIAETNRSDITLQDTTKNLIGQAKIKNLSPEEQFKHVFRASSHLLRGLSRHQSGENELRGQALEDIEAALADFHRLGIENELVWIAESYVYVNNNEREKAAGSLTKLQGSRYLTHKERELIDHAKEEIENRDPDSALNFLTDKVIMYRLASSYALSYTTEIQWMQLLERTEQGRRILQRFTELEQILEKAKDHLNLESLREKGESLLKELTSENVN